MRQLNKIDKKIGGIFVQNQHCEMLHSKIAEVKIFPAHVFLLHTGVVFTQEIVVVLHIHMRKNVFQGRKNFTYKIFFCTV